MNLNAYVGLEWADKGRGPDAYDCWGLCVAIYADRLGIALPSLSDRYTTPADRQSVSALIAHERPAWTEIEPGQEQPLDLVLMTEAGEPRHVGLVAAPSFVLHMQPRRSSVIEPYTSAKLKSRLSGFFRHRDA